jgi:hypothetical protein
LNEINEILIHGNSNLGGNLKIILEKLRCLYDVPLESYENIFCLLVDIFYTRNDINVDFRIKLLNIMNYLLREVSFKTVQLDF